MTKQNAYTEITNLWIQVRDGTRLAARLWLPKDAYENPVPCLLEYIPYRKRDFTSERDEPMHKFFAVHGYASIRVDMRGSGDSDGILEDEYLPVEQLDGVDVVNWLAKQPWCNGTVGMFGKSWGGITSLQVATYNPAPLKAIAPVGASVDRYYDDGGYFAGAHVGETIGWGAQMLGYNCRPADPALFENEKVWKRHWLVRLEKTPLFLLKWLSHPKRDDYWLQGTVLHQFNKIKCPIYVVSGWLDCWPNTVLRVMEKAKSLVWGMSGPWSHVYPTEPMPKPDMDYLNEMLLFWDATLKGRRNELYDKNRLHLYVQTDIPTDRRHMYRKGYWVAEPCWPSPNVTEETWYLGSSQLEKTPFAKEGDIRLVSSALDVGYASGEYMPMVAEADYQSMPGEQCYEDSQSIVFDSAPVQERVVIMGGPRASFRVATDMDCGMVVARLCDITPSGESCLITYGILNLAQRNGREMFADVKPNIYYDVKVRLNDIAHELKPGHRLRLAVSGNYFPMAWPLPKKATLSLDCFKSCLTLPVRLAPAEELPVRATFKRGSTKAEIDPRIRLTEWYSERFFKTEGKKSIMGTVMETPKTYFKKIDWTYWSRMDVTFETDKDDPLQAKATYVYLSELERKGFKAGTKSRLIFSCDEMHFILDAVIKAYHNGKKIFERTWDERVPRAIF
jgi:putative CocE/NonD family hydrolase